MEESKQEDYSVGQVARVIGVSSSTIRSWTDRFSNHTSQLAQPDEGQERRFTADDISLFNTVQTLRSQGEPMSRILPRIDEGERLEPVDQPEPPPPRQRQDKSLITEEHRQLERNFARMSGEFDAVKSERDYLRSQVTEISSQVTDLTERAVSAETRLEILEKLVDQQPSEEAESSRPWWKFW